MGKPTIVITKERFDELVLTEQRSKMHERMLNDFYVELNKLKKNMSNEALISKQTSN